MKTRGTGRPRTFAAAMVVATAFAPAASAGARASAAPLTGGSVHVDGRWTVTVHGRSGRGRSRPAGSRTLWSGTAS